MATAKPASKLARMAEWFGISEYVDELPIAPGDHWFYATKVVNTNVKPEDREEPESDEEHIAICAYCGNHKPATSACAGCGGDRNEA